MENRITDILKTKISVRKEFDQILSDQKIAGERISNILRWVLIGFLIFIVIVSYIKHRFTIEALNLSLIGAVVASSYGLFVTYLLKKNKYKSILGYISPIIDVSVVSFVISVFTIYDKILAPVSNPIILVYFVVLISSSFRLMPKSILYALIVLIIEYGIILFLSYQVYSKLPFSKEVSSGDLFGSFVRLGDIFLGGIFLYFLIKAIRRIFMKLADIGEKSINHLNNISESVKTSAFEVSNSSEEISKKLSSFRDHIETFISYTKEIFDNISL